MGGTGTRHVVRGGRQSAEGGVCATVVVPGRGAATAEHGSPQPPYHTTWDQDGDNLEQRHGHGTRGAAYMSGDRSHRSGEGVLTFWWTAPHGAALGDAKRTHCSKQQNSQNGRMGNGCSSYGRCPCGSSSSKCVALIYYHILYCHEECPLHECDATGSIYIWEYVGEMRRSKPRKECSCTLMPHPPFGYTSGKLAVINLGDGRKGMLYSKQMYARCGGLERGRESQEPGP